MKLKSSVLPYSLLLLGMTSIGWTQSIDRVAMQRPSEQSASRDLRINWGTKDTEYRQQVLVFTPLGSSYADVKAFVWREWLAGFHTPQKVPLSQKDIFLVPKMDTAYGRPNLAGQTPHIFIPSLDFPFSAFRSC